MLSQKNKKTKKFLIHSIYFLFCSYRFGKKSLCPNKIYEEQHDDRKYRTHTNKQQRLTIPLALYVATGTIPSLATAAAEAPGRVIRMPTASATRTLTSSDSRLANALRQQRNIHRRRHLQQHRKPHRLAIQQHLEGRQPRQTGS